MAHLLEVSPPGISTLWGRRKVRVQLLGLHACIELALGWTPSTFVSSRGDRAKAKALRPEDFMDEEDLQELRESRTLVDTTQEMDLTGGTAVELGRRLGGEDPEEEYAYLART